MVIIKTNLGRIETCKNCRYITQERSLKLLQIKMVKLIPMFENIELNKTEDIIIRVIS